MKEQKNKITVHPKRLGRSIAKATLDREGVHGYNKPTIIKGKHFPSVFSRNWRALAAEAAARKPKKKKGAKA